jgi:uncharacterized protein YegL
MAFDPSKYKAPVAKPLPVILLLDASGSMEGAKIANLNEAVRAMLNEFADSSTSEVEINVAIIAFGTSNGVELITPQDKPYVKASKLKDNVPILSAKGMTPLGTALRMAKDMIDDKSVTPSPCYKPAVVVVSDGQPNDEWKRPLEDFINIGRSSKCQRLAVGIGKDVNEDVLRQFISDQAFLFVADTADEIKKAFQFVTNSVSVRAKSGNPNVVPNLSRAVYDRNNMADYDDDEPDV